MASQGQARRGAGLGPQDHGRRAEPLDRAVSASAGTAAPNILAGRPSSPSAAVSASSGRLCCSPGTQARTTGPGAVVSWRCAGARVVAAQGRGDMPGQQVLDLDVAVAGRRPLAAHRVQASAPSRPARRPRARAARRPRPTGPPPPERRGVRRRGQGPGTPCGCLPGTARAGAGAGCGRSPSGTRAPPAPSFAVPRSRGSGRFPRRAAASAGASPADVSRHTVSTTATSCGVQRRCRPSVRTAGPMP